MVTLFWGNQGNFEKVAYCPKDEVYAHIMEFLKNKGMNKDVYYIRAWVQGGRTYYDYGKWDTFFYSVPFEISYP